MLLLTIVVVSILFFISFCIFDKDLLAPPTAVALTFLLGCLCCFYNEKKWALDFSINSFYLISAGLIATIIGGVIGVFLSNLPQTGSFRFIKSITSPEEIKVDPIKTIIIVFFQLVTIILVFIHIRSITGYSSWLLAVAKYKEMTGLWLM